MSATPITQPVSLLRPVAGLGYAPKGASPDKLKAVAQQFEASFIGAMLQPMFDSISTSPPFGGGEGESTFRSFLVDAMAKQMVKSGGIGLAPAVQREMLKMQQANAPAAPTAPDAKEAQ
jgi:Rod binding domain-containing protein